MSRNFVLGSESDGVLDDDFLAWFAYAPGLFTLDDTDLGILDVQWLGGLGAGVVIGNSSSAGSVAGVEGYSGSANGSQANSGSVTGTINVSGLVTGSQVSSGFVAGDEGAQGVVIGSNTSSGTAAGAPGFSVAVSGAQTNSGAAAGSPSLFGACSGSSVSGGFVFGTQPTPSRGGSYKPKFDYSKKPKPRPIKLSGASRGSSSTTGSAAGRCGYSGGSVGLVASDGHCSGVRYPSDELVARWVRQKQENDLLMLELM